MNAILRQLLLAALIAAGTVFLGWWSVPVSCGLYALLRRSSVAPREAMLASLLAWIVLLGRQMQYASFPLLLDRLGKIFPLPGVGVMALTLVLAMALGWSAARVVTAVSVSHKS